MPDTYVLIDYENVQPESLRSLNSEHFRVFLFLGASQTRIPVELVLALQVMGDRARIVQCSASGANALDFHIAFYAGEILATDPAAAIHVVSKDRGFDPLIEHIKGRKVTASRVAAIADLLPGKSSIPTSPAARLELVLAKLKKSESMPRSDKTLKNTINTMFQKKLANADVEAIVGALKEAGVVALEGKKLVYTFPE